MLKLKKEMSCRYEIIVIQYSLMNEITNEYIGFY